MVWKVEIKLTLTIASFEASETVHSLPQKVYNNDSMCVMSLRNIRKYSGDQAFFSPFLLPLFKSLGTRLYYVVMCLIINLNLLLNRFAFNAGSTESISGKCCHGYHLRYLECVLISTCEEIYGNTCAITSLQP